MEQLLNLTHKTTSVSHGYVSILSADLSPKSCSKSHLFSLDERGLYTVFYFLPNIHFSSALYFVPQIMDRYLICMYHQLSGRKADCYCNECSLNHSQALFYFFPELLQQVNSHNIPYFAPGAVLLTAFTSVFPQGS